MLNFNWDSEVNPSVYVYIGGTSFTNTSIQSFDINESIIDDNKLSVGNTCNSTISIKFLNILDDGTDNTDVLNDQLINQSFLVYIKSGTGASSNDIPLGSFVTTDVKIDGIITTIQGEGRFNHGRLSWNYVTSLDWGYEHSISQLVNDIDAIDNIDTSMLVPNYVLPPDSDTLTFEGKTRKEMLGDIAAMYGMNVYLNRTGKPQFKDIPAAIDNPVISLTTEDFYKLNTNYNTTQVTNVYITYVMLEYNQQEQETEVVKGEGEYTISNPDDTMNNIQVEIDIPFASNNTISPLANKLLGYEYTAFQADIVGNPNLEVGDKIQITDIKGNTYTGIIFSITHSYDGGFKQTITCNTDNTTVQNKKKTGTISGGGVDEDEVKQDVSVDITTGGTELNEAVKETATEAATTSTVAEAINAFNLDSVFESLITNIKPCLLKYSAADAWVYVNTAPSNYIRNYIKIFENKLQFIESHFVQSNTYTDANTELFKLGNQQVYYTSITGADAYKYLTFTNPTVLHGTDIQTIEYQARIPKSTNDYIKSEFAWEYNSTYQTYEPILTFGTGDGQGRGKYKFYKDNDSGRFVYTSRTNGNEYGFKIKDDGVYDVFNGVDYKHRIEPVFDTLNDVPQDFPDDQFFFIKTIS